MFSFPPTPTPLPPAAAAPINLPDNVSVWESSPYIINLWNFFGQYTPVVQIALIALLVFTAIFIIMRVVDSLNEGENGSRRQNIRVTVRQPIRRRRRR